MHSAELFYTKRALLHRITLGIDMQGRNYINHYILLLDRRIAEGRQNEARKGGIQNLRRAKLYTKRGSLEMQREERGMMTKEPIGKPPLMNSANVEKCEARLYRERERRWADCWRRER